MDVNKEVILSLGILSEKDKSFFGLFCAKRISGLYELFDHLIEHEKLESPNKNYELVRGIIKYLEESLLNDIEIQRSTIDGFINDLKSLPFNDLYGSCDAFMLAANVLSSIENVLNFHSSGSDYYEELFEELSDQNGWVVCLNMPPQTQYDFIKAHLNRYIELMELDNWRTYKPFHLFRKIDSELSARIKY